MDKEEDEHNSQNEIYVEFERPDQQYHEDDNSDFVSMMSVVAQRTSMKEESRPPQRASALMRKWIQ